MSGFDEPQASHMPKLILLRRFEAHAILRKNVTKHLKIITKERQFAQIKKRKIGVAGGVTSNPHDFNL